MATIRDQYPSTNFDSTVGLNTTTAYIRGQAFDIDANAMLTACEFFLRKEGSPIGNVVAELYLGTGTLGTDCVGTGSPVATSAAVNASTIPTDAAMVEFTFDGTYEMAAGTDYVIVLNYPSGDGTNFIRMYRDASSPTHEGNYVWSSGGTWSYTAAADFIFAIWGEDPGVTKTASDTLLVKLTETAIATSIVLTATKDGAHIDLSWA